MGAGIAEVCARAGLDVVVVESSEDAAKAGRARLERSLRRAAERGKIEQRRRGPRPDPRGRPTSTRWPTGTSWSRRSSRTRHAKTELFRRLDEIVESPDAILASNTSSIPIMKLGVVTSRPDPGHRHPLLQPGAGAAAGRAGPVAAHLDRHHRAGRAPSCEDALGKQAIDCQDRAGFVVNALLIPFILSAIRMYRVRVRLGRGHRPRPGAAVRRTRRARWRWPT